MDEHVVNAVTGEVTRRPSTCASISEADALAHAAAEAEAQRIAEHNAALIAEMDAADVRIVRARLEGDTERIAEHIKAQAERRSRLIR
jgi:hypothetical protein